MTLSQLAPYYGFGRLPFSRRIAASALYRSSAHQEALARIAFVIEQEALGLLTGEVGAGKTVAARAAVASLEASRHTGIKRFLYACSAAVYSDAASIPVSEEAALKPLSPYAMDKLSGEHYLLHYYRTYGLAATSFRFFNIYGPRQDPSSPYSGVISIFVERLMHNQPVTIYGDGTQTRDFVYVVDLADLLARAAHGMEGNGGVFNVGTGARHSLLQLLTYLEKLSGKKIERRHQPARPGDIQHSCADVSRLTRTFGAAPATTFEQGLKQLLKSLDI